MRNKSFFFISVMLASVLTGGIALRAEMGAEANDANRSGVVLIRDAERERAEQDDLFRYLASKEDCKPTKCKCGDKKETWRCKCRSAYKPQACFCSGYPDEPECGGKAPDTTEKPPQPTNIVAVLARIDPRSKYCVTCHGVRTEKPDSVRPEHRQAANAFLKDRDRGPQDPGSIPTPKPKKIKEPPTPATKGFDPRSKQCTACHEPRFGKPPLNISHEANAPKPKIKPKKPPRPEPEVIPQEKPKPEKPKEKPAESTTQGFDPRSKRCTACHEPRFGKPPLNIPHN